MKKTANTLLRFVLMTGLSGGLAATAVAQTTQPAPGETRVKVTERNGDEMRLIERTYRTDGMTDERRDAIVNHLIDSLRATRKGKDSQISVTVESDRGTSRTRLKQRNNSEQEITGDVYVTPKTPRVGAIPRPPRAPMSPNARLYGDDFALEGTLTFNDSLGRKGHTFRFDRRKLDSMANSLQEFGYTFRREMAPLADRLSRMQGGLNRLDERLTLPFDAWARAGANPLSTIRGLDAYPSNPDQYMLNVRFTAPGKGDVQIMVTNPKGKEVAKRELKDFSGEFVGQVDLGRKAEGVYFVTVTQNEDGAVRRVVLKKDGSGK